MADEPPPNPDTWICDVLPSRKTAESSDTRQETAQRHAEAQAWAVLISFRNNYRVSHGTATRF